MRGVHAIGADERGEILHRRILADHLDQFLLPLAMAGNDTVSGACEMPRITPVSCTGKKPLGTMM
jgi:hypothetical protein